MICVEFEPRFEHWRKLARGLNASGIDPSEILWQEQDRPQAALFAASEPRPAATALRVPKRFLDPARLLALHRSPSRWSLLYRILFRLTHGEPALLAVEFDPDVREFYEMEKSVRRDMHKMKAFVRFRRTDTGEFVAWHRPDHRIIQAMAPWFVDRFGSMRWAILSPDESAYWDTETLRFGPGVPRSEAPQDDAMEDLWRSYYASVFNPARLNLKAMNAEMAVRYHSTLPEAQIIPELVRAAASRETAMRTADKPSAAPWVPQTSSLKVLAEAARACQGCDLYKYATQVVFGEGPKTAPLMFVGEQPGDREDIVGRPFVGPAGQLWDRAMKDAGIDRSHAYVTNAVKHFKFEERGKRRIHKTPRGIEVAACHPWLEAEIEVVKPRFLIALGSTAAVALMGRDFRITRDRGKFFPHAAAEAFMATVHPSFLLRVPDEEKEAEYRRFVEDLIRLDRKLAA